MSEGSLRRISKNQPWPHPDCAELRGEQRSRLELCQHRSFHQELRKTSGVTRWRILVRAGVNRSQFPTTVGIGNPNPYHSGPKLAQGDRHGLTTKRDAKCSTSMILLHHQVTLFRDGCGQYSSGALVSDCPQAAVVNSPRHSYTFAEKNDAPATRIGHF